MTEENIQEQEEVQPVVEEVVQEPAEEVAEEVQQEQEDPAKTAYEEGKRFAEQGAKKSIAKEVSKRKRLEQQLQELASQNQKILQHIEAQKANVPPPQYQDFQNSENPDYEYQKAIFNHLEAQKGVQSKKQNTEEKPSVPGVIDQVAEQKYIAREMQFAQKNPEYVEAKENLTPFIQGNADLINLLHECGPEVVHHLGENLDLADEISGMSPAQMGRRLAKLENNLKPKAAPTAPKRQSEPIGSPRTTGKGVKSIADMDQREYNAYMSDPKNFI
jgi:hypothetical protein